MCDQVKFMCRKENDNFFLSNAVTFSLFTIFYHCATVKTHMTLTSQRRHMRISRHNILTLSTELVHFDNNERFIMYRNKSDSLDQFSSEHPRGIKLNSSHVARAVPQFTINNFNVYYSQSCFSMRFSRIVFLWRCFCCSWCRYIEVIISSKNFDVVYIRLCAISKNTTETL